MSDDVKPGLPSGLTIGEAEAWRAGWRAGVEAASAMVRERSARYASRAKDAMDEQTAYGREECAMAFDYTANAIESMEPPA